MRLPLVMARICRVGRVEVGKGKALAIIAGPCVLESLELGMTVGREVAAVCRGLGLSYVFKASFDKANRSSINSARGPGLEKGLSWLKAIGAELGTPITTDIHEADQAEAAAAVVDLIQIPAFLCRQTDLLIAAGAAAKHHGRAVNVKKGQFMAPSEMGGVVRKLGEAGCGNVMLTERGTFFGYGRLVNDFIGVGDLMELDTSKFDSLGSPPVCFDVTHSTQLPGAGEQTGGRPERAVLLAKAATAAGVDALFVECHPEPRKAMSDSSTMMALKEMRGMLEVVARVRGAVGG